MEVTRVYRQPHHSLVAQSPVESPARGVCAGYRDQVYHSSWFSPDDSEVDRFRQIVPTLLVTSARTSASGARVVS